MVNRYTGAAQGHLHPGGTGTRILRTLSLCSLIYCAIALAAGNAPAQVSVLTQHNDIARTGQNTNETILNTSNVNKIQFGKLFSQAVTGQIYAQPLYVPNVSIAGGTHNVVIVATEEDMVYAFDADSNTGANASPLWSASMVDAAHGGTGGEEPLDSATTTGCTDTQPYVGITSTPVIDGSSQTIYVEAKSTDGAGNYFHRLHALSLTTGEEKSPGPVRIAGSANGSTFQDLYQQERPGLLLQNGVVYLAYASHCDTTPYEGWLFAYDTATFTQQSVLVTEPNGKGLGGFWMSGSGIAADSTGNIYIPSGNGNFDTSDVPPTQLGDTLLKVGTTSANLSLLDYFTPSDQACLASDDTDLGSGGALLLPDQTGATYPHILVQAGKEGMVYVVNRDQLTSNNSHYNGVDTCMSTDPEILEESPAVGGMWSMPAYWNNNLYFWGSGDVLKMIPVTNGFPDFTNITGNSTSLGFPGATPSISSNGTAPGTAIVWAIDSTKYGSPGPGPGPAVLHAFDATNISTELWNSAQSGTRDRAGNAVKFAVPTIANGKAYIGTSTELDVYGLLAAGTQQAATPVITPGTETVHAPVHVQITDSTPGAAIYYTTDGTTPTSNSTKYTATFIVSSSAVVQAIAAASGYANSDVANAAYTINVATPNISPKSGTHVSSVMVAIADPTAGSTIYYTSDGTTPTTGSTPYGGAFKLTSSATVQAIAAAPGYANSNVTSAEYTIDVATPVLSRKSGTYVGTARVALADSTLGSTIYYTTDGTTPTTNSTPYTGAFNLTSSATVQAIAAAPGCTNSALASATYTVLQPPEISPPHGTYSGSITITITDATSGAAIYYTTDGTKPTPGQGTTVQYDGPFMLNATAQVKAIATLNSVLSTVSTRAYAISP